MTTVPPSQTNTESNIVSLSDRRRQADAPSITPPSAPANSPGAKKALDTLRKIEAELDFRTNKIVQTMDEQDERIKALEQAIHELVKAFRIMSTAIQSVKRP